MIKKVNDLSEFESVKKLTGKLKKQKIESLDWKSIVKDVLMEMKIFFSTNESDKKDNPPFDVHFYQNLVKKLSQKQVVPSSYPKRDEINTYLEELEKNNEIFPFSQDLLDAWFPKIETAIEMPFTFDEFLQLFAGAKIKDGKLSESKSILSHWRLLLFNEDASDALHAYAQEALIEKYQKIIALSTSEFIKGLDVTQAEKLDYLEPFDEQAISDPRSKIQLIDFYYDILQYTKHSLRRVCPFCSTRIGNPKDKAGLIEIKTPNDVTMPLDEVIRRKTILADYYSQNTQARCFTFNSVIQDNPTVLTNPTYQNFIAEQQQFEKELMCPNPECPTRSMKRPPLLTKEALFRAEKYMRRMLTYFIRGKSICLQGVPGDGKTTIAVDLLEYLKWRYGTPYQTYNVNDGTTVGKLSGATDLSTLSSKIKRVDYGILSRCLFKRGWKPDNDSEIVGKGSNLLLDELNRTEFKQISFIMGFLASPWSYTIDPDNFRRMYYPNRYGNCCWVLIATINKGDVGNEKFSIAAKGRFVFIEIEYKDKNDLRYILEHSLQLTTETLWVAQYLEKIFDWTVEVAAGGNIKYHAGIRHLLGVHRAFLDTLRLRMRYYDVYSPDNLHDAALDSNKTMSKKSVFGPSGDISDAELSELFSDVVKDNLLNIIVDESSPTNIEALNDEWSTTMDAIFPIILSNYKTLIKE